MHKCSPSDTFLKPCPIVSSIGTFHYDLAHFLCDLLSLVVPDDYSCKDIFSFVSQIKVRMQCFSRKIWIFFFYYSYSFRKDLPREYLVVLKFLLEVPEFKENVLFCIITVIKVHAHLLILLRVITILAALFHKWMNLHYSSIKILSFVCSVFIIQ